MPKAQMPTTLKGWAVTLIASMVGFVAGNFVLAEISKRVKG